MRTTISLESISRTKAAMPPVDVKSFPYKTIAIYPDFSDVGSALVLLNNAGFTNDQISLLGREQEDWQNRLNAKWKTLHTAKGALEGAALGAIPGLVLVAGVALTGGIGLLAEGPMVGALSALGMGAFGGSVMGGVATSELDRSDKEVNVEAEVEEAIGLGKWVIVAHGHDKAEALRAQALLPDSRILLDTGSGAELH
jgi:hypothetical protein